jgi:hypothetical protein
LGARNAALHPATTWVHLVFDLRIAIRWFVAKRVNRCHMTMQHHNHTMLHDRNRGRLQNA